MMLRCLNNYKKIRWRSVSLCFYYNSFTFRITARITVTKNKVPFSLCKNYLLTIKACVFYSVAPICGWKTRSVTQRGALFACPTSSRLPLESLWISVTLCQHKPQIFQCVWTWETEKRVSQAHTSVKGEERAACIRFVYICEPEWLHISLFPYSGLEVKSSGFLSDSKQAC